ncbi:MAG: hypothetical protein ACK42D_04090 [Candidatus Paceibacteria bacterium]
MKEKLKSFLADDSLYMASIVVGVGVLAFLLGRLSVGPIAPYTAESVNPLSLCPTTVCPAQVTALPTSLPAPTVQGQAVTSTEVPQTTAPYVASKSGARYHHITCPGAKQIKEENKIYFQTVEAAMAAGYTKAANCNQ